MASARTTGPNTQTETLQPVDLSAWAEGNVGIPYVTRFESERPGPHVLLCALTHGNELCGAHALNLLLRREIRPTRGTLTLCFANVAAYLGFDAANPLGARFLDCDLNRLWSPGVLNGAGDSREHRRARELRPLVNEADYLLDIHSMQIPSPPLMLCGLAAKGRILAEKLGMPEYIVADAGHTAGVRLRDYGAFADPKSHRTALLVECGQHLAPDSRAVAIATACRFLLALEMVEAKTVADLLPLAPAPPRQRFVEVTRSLTVTSDDFRFTRRFAGMEAVATAGTVIAHDGGRAIGTPYDDCILVMPTERVGRGQTAVRFGRIRA